jgi:hypothetical protein
LRTPADVVTAVPYLIGFHPSDSVVLLGVRRRRMVFQVRADLPAVGRVAAVAARLAGLLGRQGATSAVAVFYARPGPCTPLLAHLLGALVRRGVHLVDAIWVHGGRYAGMTCRNGACCPPEGRPLPAAGPTVDAAVQADLTALPSRAALARRLSPVRSARRARMPEQTRRAYVRLAELVQAGAGLPGAEDTDPPTEVGAGRPVEVVAASLAGTGVGPVAGMGRVPLIGSAHERVRRSAATAIAAALIQIRTGSRPSDADLAWLSVLIAHPAAARHAWLGLGGQLSAQVVLWTEVVRRAEPRLRARPAALLAFAAWRAGEGALASIALERALALDAREPLAELFNEVLARGLSPALWTHMQRAGPVAIASLGSGAATPQLEAAGSAQPEPDRVGVDVHRAAAQEADQGEAGVPGEIDREAARRGHGRQHRNTGHRRLLHQLEAGPAGNQQDAS